MSTTIDEKVVEMRFDNANFEKNISSTLNSLNNLNKTIDGMSGKNLNIFDGLTKSANSLDFSGLTSAVEGIASKFSNLGIIGVTALTNIANKAVDAGTQIVKSLTIDPVSTGFSEYELKMGSVQTIMNGANVDLETTMNTLEELNKYADDTIYSFSDMTTNIGKFVNAGVELDTAVKAIKGISNEAAVSGANAVEASRAMYNIAQAIGTGSMKLIDWKSIENANMATMAFKQTLIDTGKELNTIRKGDTSKIDVSEITAQNFRESISGVEGQTWITTEVMMKALAKYADETTEFGKKAYAAARDVKTFTMLMDTLKEAAQSGWAETMENIFGDFNQAKEMWTKVNEEISGILENQANARNDLLKAWKSGGGRDALLNSIANVWFTLKNLFIDVKKAFTNVFPKTTASQLINMTKNLESFTKKIREMLNSTDTLKKVYVVFNGLFSAVGKVRDGFKELLSIVKPVAIQLQNAFVKVFSFGDTINALNVLINIGEAFKNLSTKIKDFLTNSQNLEKIGIVFQGVFSIVNILKKAFISLVNIIKDLLSPFASVGGSIGQIILDLTAKIASFFVALDKGTSVIKSFDDFKDKFIKAITVIKLTIKALTGEISTSRLYASLENNLISRDLIVRLTKFVDEFKNKIEDFKNIFSGKNSSEGLGNLKNKLLELTNFKDSALFDKLGSNFQKNKELIGTGVDWLIEKMKALQVEMPDMGPFYNALKKLGSGVLNVVVSGLNLIASAFNGLAKAFENSPLLTLKTILKSITSAGLYLEFKNLISVLSSNIEDNKLGKALVSLLNSIKGGNLIEAIKQLKENLKSTQKEINAKVIMEISISIGILAASLVALSLVDTEKLAWSLGAITAVIVELVGAFTALNKLNTSGTSGFTGVLNRLAGNSISKVTTSILKFSIAVGILGLALSKLTGSGASPTEMLTAVAGLSALLWQLVAVTKVLGSGNSKSFLGATTSIILFTTAVTQLVRPLTKLCQFSWDQMLVGVGGLSAIIWELIAVTKFSKGVKMGDVTGLSTLTVAVSLLAFSLKGIAELSLDQLVVGISGLTVVLGELVIMAKMLGDANSTKEGAAGMVAMSIAVAILANALNSLGNLSADQLTQGFLALLSMMGGLLVFLKLLPDTMFQTAAACLVMAVALDAVVLGIKSISSISFNELIVGLAGMAGGMLILVAATKLMEGTLAGAAAMLVVSIGLLALAGAVKILASLDLGQVAVALLGLVGGLLALAAGLLLMQTAIPGAIALTIASVGLLALAGALYVLSSISLKDMCVGIIGMGAAILVFAGAAALLTPLLIPMAGLAAVLLLLSASVAVVGVGLYLISEALASLGANGGLGIEILGNLCIILGENLGVIAQFAAEVLALGYALLTFGTGALLAGAGSLVLGAGLVTLAIGMAAVTGAAVLMVVGLENISERLPKILDNIEKLPEDFKDCGKNVIKGFIKGINDSVKDAKTAIKNLGSSILKSFREKLGIHSPSKESESDAKNYEAGWEKGIKDSESSATETTESFGSKILNSFKSGLGELTGGSYDLGTIDITGDVDTSELTSQFDMDELLKGYNTDGMNLTSMENVTSATQKQTDAINDQTDAIKEQTEATEKLNLTREAILKDFDSNGTNLLHSDTDARKTEIKDSINNLNIDRFNKFFSNYGMSLDDVKEKTGATVADIATIFSDLPTLMDQEQIQFGDALYQELTQNLGDRSKIKELYDQTTDTLKNGLDKDSFLKALGFDTIDRLNQIFVATASNIDDFDKTITDTTKKAVISADELEKKAKEVIQGKYGNGADRVKALGDQYAVIQNKVNEMLGSSVRHDTNITVTTDTSGIEETKESLETLSISAKTAGDNVRQSVMEHANSIPTSVVQAAKDAMSYQDKVLQNGSKLPSEVVDKLKAMREEAEKTSDVIEVSSTKSAETMDRYASYLESVSRNADKLPTSVSQAISSLNNTESTTIKTEVDSTEVTEATSDVQELIDTMTAASDTTISPSVETTEVTPTFNLSSIDTTSVKTELTKALNDAAKDIDVKADITIDFAKVKDQFSKFFTQMTSDISNKASQYSTGMMNAFKVILDKVVSDLRTYGETNFTPLGGEFVQKIANGVSKGGSNTLANSFKVIVDNAIRDLRQYSEEFVTLGKNFTEGLAKGINENSENIKKAATNAAKAAYNAVKKELDINSPSKKTELLGMYTDEGLAKGLDKYSSIVEDSATGVGSRLSDSLKETLADINLDGIDTAPTIRPILDLTDVESKASTLDSILSQQQASEISASYNLRGEQANMSDNRMNEQMVMMNNKLTNLLDVLSNQQPTPVDVNVELQGDARSLFNMVKKQGQLYTRTTGKYAF